MIDNENIKKIVNYILILTIVVVFSSLFYSIGQKKGVASAHRPIVVKYSDFTNRNILENFERAEIKATPEQLDVFIKGIKGNKKKSVIKINNEGD